MTESYRPFTDLSPSQRAHWEQVLENAERMVTRAKLMLGIKVVGETVEVKDE